MQLIKFKLLVNSNMTNCSLNGKRTSKFLLQFKRRNAMEHISTNFTLENMVTSNKVMDDGTASTIGIDEVIDNFTEGLETKTKDSFMDEVETLLTYKVATIIAKYWSPILVPIGLVGNVLSLIIMVKSSYRKLSTCIYMAASLCK